MSTKHPNLVAEWKLEGNANDNSGNAHNGTIFYVSTPPTLISGKFGKCYYFTDASSGISIPAHVDFNFTTNFSISFWTKIHNGGHVYAPFIGKYNWRYHIGMYLGFYIDLWINNANELHAVSPLSADVWYHLCWVHTNVYDRVYVNGDYTTNQGINGHLPNPLGTNDALYIASYSGNYGNYGAYIDEIKIFNKALITEDVKRVMLGFLPL
jgi:hypothetical protein